MLYVQYQIYVIACQPLTRGRASLRKKTMYHHLPYVTPLIVTVTVTT